MPMPSGSSPSTDRIRALMNKSGEISRMRRPESLPPGGAAPQQSREVFQEEGWPPQVQPQVQSSEIPDMGQYVEPPMSEPPLQMPRQPQELNKTYKVPLQMMPNQSRQEMAFWNAARGF